jgi:hypothetical protein
MVNKKRQREQTSLDRNTTTIEKLLDFMKHRHRPNAPFSLLSQDNDQLNGSIKVMINLNKMSSIKQDKPSICSVKITNEADGRDQKVLVRYADTLNDPLNLRYKEVKLDQQKMIKLGKHTVWEIKNESKHFICLRIETSM